MNDRVAIDVGGTFTDLVFHDGNANRLTVAKVLSTAPDPSEGVLGGFDVLLDRAGTTADEITYFVHASTVVSNLVLERKGERTALITTAGFRDVLHLQRQKRADLYDLAYTKPRPLIDRRDIHEVIQRNLADGSIAVELDEESVLNALNRISHAGIRSVAVSFLHSYANPAHEQRVREIATVHAPDVTVSLSSDVAPKLREYERTSTTALNAYVAPQTAAYLDRMGDSLARSGMRRPLHVMQCSGGVMLSDAIKRVPVNMLESGPAAGALAAAAIGAACGRSRVIGFDMGGTTAKVSIIDDDEPQLVEEFEVARTGHLQVGSGLPVTVPAVDLIEIGTGGGSIARIEMGVLAVGPISAGASPGPACYGLGGVEPTVTDANLVLGYLDAENFLGGEMPLNLDAAREAIDSRIASPLGISVPEAAYAVHSLASATMANAMRVMTIQRGFDPRTFSVVALGGAAPSHVAEIASDCGIPEVIVPPSAGVASAVGLLAAPVKFELARTLLTPIDSTTIETLRNVFGALQEHGITAMRESAIEAGIVIHRQVRMRFVGQGYEVPISILPADLEAATADGLRSRFVDAYEQLYGYADSAAPIEIVDWRLSAMAPAPDILPSLTGAPTEDADGGASVTQAYFPSAGGFTNVSLLPREGLPVGAAIKGPALIAERESTLLVPPDVHASLHPSRSVVLKVAATTEQM